MLLRRVAVVAVAVLANACWSPLDVESSILSVSLGGDCPSQRAGFADAAGACAPPPADCQMPCQQSSVQITFKASPSTPFDSHVQIAKVYLVDAKTNVVVDELTAREPTVYSGNQYVSWNQTLKPGDDVRTSYKLSAPDWTKIGNGNAWSTHGQLFRLRIELKVDGVSRTIESAQVTREPEVVT